MYKLLTPGPLTTTDTVKREMLVDHCTWDDDYKSITQNIRKELLELVHVTEDEYTVVLMQGSGTFGVESVVTSSVGSDDKILVCEMVHMVPEWQSLQDEPAEMLLCTMRIITRCRMQTR